MLDKAEIDALFPADLPEPAHWEAQYPPRSLPPGAEVTRVGPSPTGFAHLGGVYVAMIDRDIADQSGGTYFVRIEDTDQARQVEGATTQFDRAFAYFRVASEETDETGDYGPYTQSRRCQIYTTYVRELLRQGKAYLCFATKDELAAAADEQRAAKVPTGYYGRWALWRDAPDDRVRARLSEGAPYVVRFRSPGNLEARVAFSDLIRGPIEAADNRNDAVILKSSDSPQPLPTYHLAHVVDDHLMRVTLVIRGEEWISSVPLHLQLFDALGYPPIPYAHIAPLLKQEGKTKRKLSKRKDPEADVDFYIAAGYPADGVLYYLRGLANARLTELPIAEALKAPLRLDECGVSGALVDLVKLEDITADLIAAMRSEDIIRELVEWATEFDPDLAHAVASQPDLALRVLAIEREGVENPRKDLRKWSDFRPVYGYFFATIFDLVTDPLDERFDGLDPAIVRRLVSQVLQNYWHTADADEWFGQVRSAAESNLFAATVREYKQNRESYVGSIREAALVIRVLLTGSRHSTGLHLVADALGESEVSRRLGAVLAS